MGAELGPEFGAVDRIVAAIDLANAADPNQFLFEGESAPLALLQGQRASFWLSQLGDLEISPELEVAVRAHHLRRFEILRSDFEVGRVGYKRWKRAALHHTANCLKQLVSDAIDTAMLSPELSLNHEFADRCASLVLRANLRDDPQAQAVQDCASLVFLELQLDALVLKLGFDEVVEATRKTTTKMSLTALSMASRSVNSDIGRQVLAKLS